MVVNTRRAREPGEYPPGTACTVLDALVDLALSTEDLLVASSVTHTLKFAGSLPGDGGPLNPGIVERLETIAVGSTFPAVRASSVSMLRFLVDREGVIQYLTRMAARTFPATGNHDRPRHERLPGG